MIAKPLENFRKEFLDFYKGYVLTADFDKQGKLIIFTNPYLDFENVIYDMCDMMLDTVNFREHLVIQLYPFGKNEYVSVSVN